MRHSLLATIVVCLFAASARADDIRGSGSTFVWSVMPKWVEAFEKSGGSHISYQPIGSAAGLTEIRHEVVDFAVSETPSDGAQLLRDGLTQFPLVIGAIVAVVNIDGIAAGQLRVTGPLLADIYLGKIRRWSDPAIAALNPGLKLPDLTIQVVHRSDGSGTSFVWADYLSKVSPDWNVRVGAGSKVAWPVGAGVKHNQGVAESVARIRGAIGYVDFGYALREKLAYALIRNQAGNFVAPDGAGFLAATTGTDWTKDPDFNLTLTDAPVADAWPVMAISFVVMRKYPRDLGRTRDMLAFFRFVLENGRELAVSLGYLPLPPPLLHQVEASWESTR